MILNGDLRTARLQLVADAISDGTLTLYTAPQPALGAALTTQTALVAIPVPAGLTAADATLTLLLTLPPIAADGDAAWGRFVDSSAQFVADGTCGVLGSSADFQLAFTELSAGGTLIPLVSIISEG